MCGVFKYLSLLRESVLTCVLMYTYSIERTPHIRVHCQNWQDRNLFLLKRIFVFFSLCLYYILKPVQVIILFSASKGPSESSEALVTSTFIWFHLETKYREIIISFLTKLSCFWKKVPDRSIWKVVDLDNVATSSNNKISDSKSQLIIVCHFYQKKT